LAASVSQLPLFDPAMSDKNPCGPFHGASLRTEASPDAQCSTVRLLAWRLRFNGVSAVRKLALG
jgi:hypothetical protein